MVVITVRILALICERTIPEGHNATIAMFLALVKQEVEKAFMALRLLRLSQIDRGAVLKAYEARREELKNAQRNR